MKKYFLLLTILVAGGAHAWDCAYEKDIDITLDLAGSELLSVAAAAGDLTITGQAGTTAARVRGKLCVSEEEWLNEAEVHAESGRKASIAVSLPGTGGWGFVFDRYAYVDLDIEVPADLALDIRDSSGDVTVRVDESGQYAPQNEVKDYRALAGQAPAAVAPAAPKAPPKAAKPTAPWARTA